MEQHYRHLLSRSSESLDALLSDSEALQKLTVAHNFIADLELLNSAVSARPESTMIKFATRELSFALYAAAASKYRHATISLRLTLEIVLAAIYFSAHELKLRRWLSGDGDIVWNALTELEEGVFSKSFIRCFTPELAEHGRQYAAICSKAYRECSEFAHGNINTQSPSNAALGFDKFLLGAWADRVAATRVSIIFAFSARYLDVIPKDDAFRIEGLILDGLGHLSYIQSFYSKVTP